MTTLNELSKLLANLSLRKKNPRNDCMEIFGFKDLYSFSNIILLEMDFGSYHGSVLKEIIQNAVVIEVRIQIIMCLQKDWFQQLQRKRLFPFPILIKPIFQLVLDGKHHAMHWDKLGRIVITRPCIVEYGIMVWSLQGFGLSNYSWLVVYV